MLGGIFALKAVILSSFKHTLQNPLGAPLPLKGENNAANTEVHNASETSDTCSSCTISTCTHICNNDPVRGRVESEGDFCKKEECLNIVSVKDKEIEEEKLHYGGRNL